MVLVENCSGFILPLSFLGINNALIAFDEDSVSTTNGLLKYVHSNTFGEVRNLFKATKDFSFYYFLTNAHLFEVSAWRGANISAIF